MIEVDVDASVLTEVILDIEFNCDASSILTFSSSVSKHDVCGMSYQQLQMIIFFIKNLLQWPGLMVSMHELIEICDLFIQMGLKGPGSTRETSCTSRV